MVLKLSALLELSASSGFVLSNEMKAAMETSLKLKQQELGGRWTGLTHKFMTTSGKDYYVALTQLAPPVLTEGKLVSSVKYAVSQDGVTWMDLDMDSVSEESREKAGKITTWLSGDLAKIYTVEEPAPEPEAPPEPAEGEEAPPEPEPLPPIVFEVTEMERLICMLGEVTMTCFLCPKGFIVADADNKYNENPVFPGLAYPDKLSSYLHGFDGDMSADKDVTGEWALAYDSFKGVATVKSLKYPGFVHYYDATSKDCYNFYCGTGLKDTDLAFMI
eukprot:CAMPEP_0183791524 /NCGR_PEP_ID=MMETSP0803_2-20130417/1921_1 /TAXON_ID=195967 /ORGANISM="Crustomastix stigmata, Strain CCMP3273" /LENGTH=274 /DNA_ID=CAMNT_0026035843 /DNA_START=53 /DNA_END=877 /DNA_ORIENTATION=-